MIILHEVRPEQKSVFVQHREMYGDSQRRLWYLAATLVSRFKNSSSAAEHGDAVSACQLEPFDGKKSRSGTSPKPKTDLQVSP